MIRLTAPGSPSSMASQCLSYLVEPHILVGGDRADLRNGTQRKIVGM
jgi:hypothetical protein